MNSLEADLEKTGESLEHRNGIVEPVYFDVTGTAAKYSISTESK